MDSCDDEKTPVTSVVPVIVGYDRSLRTVKWIKSSLYVAILCTLACWAIGCWAHITGAGNLMVELPYGEFGREAILFGVSLIVTFVNDALGYVHTVALRWALYREGKLEWNTNFRLFTSAKTSFANRWYMNMLATGMLTLSYACASLLLIRSQETQSFVEGGEPREATGVNALALMLLGASILIQVILALLCLREYDTQIPTWSANPLANTLTALSGHSSVEHRPGRCMMPVTDKDTPAEAQKPAETQPTLWALRHVKWIVIFLWTLCFVNFIWAISMIKVSVKPLSPSSMASFRFEWTSEAFREVELYMTPNRNDSSLVWEFGPGTQMFLGILFLTSVQGVQALGLHCVELLVNMSRDEIVWQDARSRRGARVGKEPLLAALTSWRTVVLMILKTALHWLLGQSLVAYGVMASTPDIYDEYGDKIDLGFFSFSISPSRLLIYAAMSAVTAVFTTVLACWQIRSPQPAAWGHLQTLADLVDDWRTVDRRFWWGDKGVDADGVRHAGTCDAPDEVDELDMKAYYAGEHKALLIGFDEEQ